jgi:5'(3')-deoxyribonucleotidase
MIIYIDMDDTLFDFRGAHRRELERFPKMLFPQSQFGFFANLDLLPDAFPAWKMLNERHDVYFLTAPSVRNPMCYTEKRISIEKNFGYDACERLILSTNKSLLKGDILIDDYATGNHQESFDGELIQFGSTRFPDWKSVLADFKARGIL